MSYHHSYPACISTNHKGNLLFSNDFNEIYESFQPIILYLAKGYPEFWIEDFIQEGNIALLNCIRKFDASKDPSEFKPFAIASIKRKMIDMYRSLILRSPKLSETIKINIDGEEYSTEEQIPDSKRDSEILLRNLDLNLICSKENLGKIGFKQKEIEVFDLYYFKDFTLTEISKMVNISISQASKVIKK